MKRTSQSTASCDFTNIRWGIRNLVTFLGNSVVIVFVTAGYRIRTRITTGPDSLRLGPDCFSDKALSFRPLPGECILQCVAGSVSVVKRQLG